jgi:putative NADH-flavin reductase
MTTATKHLTVFGATGGTGVHIVSAALAAGHTVTAVARDPSRVSISHQRLRTVEGDVLDRTSLKGSLQDAGAVVSALGASSGREPTTVYSAGVANIIDVMGHAGVRRFVGISAIPVTPREDVGAFQRLVVFPLLYRFFGGSYADMARMERLLQNSTLDWTVIRPPRLTNGPATARYRTAVNEQLPKAGKISRADLADALLNVLDDPRTSRATIVTAY